MQGTAKVFLAVPPSLVAVSRVAPSACCLLVCWLQLLLTLRDLPAPPARPPDLAATSPRSRDPHGRLIGGRTVTRILKTSLVINK